MIELDLRLLRQPRRRRRALAAAAEAEGISFEIVYAASRGGERVFDMEPARRLLGFEAEQRWPEGLPFPLPDG